MKLSSLIVHLVILYYVLEEELQAMVDSTSLDDDGTVYSCTSNGSPADFTTSAVLDVVEG